VSYAHRANCEQKSLAVRGLGKTSQGWPIRRKYCAQLL